MIGNVRLDEDNKSADEEKVAIKNVAEAEGETWRRDKLKQNRFVKIIVFKI